MRLAIFTHVFHQKQEGRYFAYSPYVREMNIWLKYVLEVEVMAPQSPKGEAFIREAYKHPIRFTSIPSFNLLSFTEILRAVFRIPIIFFRILSVMRRADHFHLRCPGNIGLLACFAQMFFPSKPKTAKYAGNWDPNSKQPWSYRLQKWILSNTFFTRNMQVLVYGAWSKQTKNVVPFFTASFSETEREVISKEINATYKFLFCGNLVPGKQPGFALKVVENLNKRNIPAELHVYGDGELMNSLLDRAKNKAYIHIHGNQPLEVLKQVYKDSHFLILASKSEGWPKAVAEAMFFGCIPVVSNVSCVSWMLGGGSRGILLSERNVWDEKLEDSGLLDTFQKSRQFECFPETADAVSENESSTGFSETPAYRQGRLEVTGKRSLPEPVGAGEDSQDVVEDTVDRIIELINQPEVMRRMSMEAQEWSQEYTLEKFEAAIKEILNDKYKTKK